MQLHSITISRVYEPPARKEGYWVLVDRLWPRGLKKDALDFDLWNKDVTPSTALRKWFHENPANWEEFAHHYMQELKKNPAGVEFLLEQARKMPVTLFYAAKDKHHNHARVLQAVLLTWPELPSEV